MTHDEYIERKNELESCDNEEEFDDYLNEMHDEIVILGMSYLPAKVLHDTDPIAYKEEHNNFNDRLLTDLENDYDPDDE